MRRLTVRASGWQPDAFLPWLAFLSAMFLIGAVVGCTSVVMVDDSSREELYGYLSGTLATGQSAAPVELLKSFFKLSKYHLIAFACGFMAFGVILLPILIAVRGYFLAFSAAAFIKVFGTHGFALSFSTLGIQSLVSLPCLFIIAIQSLQASIYMFGTVTHKQRGAYFSPVSRVNLVRFGICMTVLFLCSLYDTFIAPLLITRFIG